MSISELRAKLESEYAQRVFSKIYDGSCPCASGRKKIDGHWVSFWSRCWRVSEQIDEGFQDLHLTTTHPDKNEIVKMIIKNLNSQEWYNPYKLLEATP